jgi:multimeric flavodoxin WrbA
MPPGIFKNFIDRCSIFYTAHTDFSKKSAIVVIVGVDVTKEIDVCLKNICDNFCKTLGIPIVAKKSFRSKSELKENYNDIFENILNKNIEKEIEKMADELYKNLSKK